MSSILSQEQSSASSYGVGGNPWFAVTLGLLGIMIGYGIGSYNGGGPVTVADAGEQIAQVPTAPVVPLDSEFRGVDGSLTKKQRLLMKLF